MTNAERNERRERKRQRERRLTILGVLGLFLLVLAVVIVQSAKGDDPPPPTYAGLTAEQWAMVATTREAERDQARFKLARRERQLRRARRLAGRLRQAMRARVSLAGAGAGTRGLLCIHQFEGAWDDPAPPYWGGVQMDLAFQRRYGGRFLAALGTADRWPPFIQLAVGVAGYLDRGFSPWPNTRRSCGI